MTKSVKIINLLIGVCGFLMMPVKKVFAQIKDDLTKSTAGKSGISITNTIPQTVGSIIALALSFVGTIFFIFIIVSGIQWMTAGGEEEKVKSAQTRIKNASIGLAITVAAYFITRFISNIFIK